MKIVWTILFNFLWLFGIAQENSKLFTSDFNLYINGEGGIGENQLSEGHRTGFGMGLVYNYLMPYNIKLGAGMEANIFGVKDQSLIGNFKRTRFIDAFIQVSYFKEISPKMQIEPCIQFGLGTIKQIADESQYNTNMRSARYNFNMGISLIYHLTESTSLFIRPLYKTRRYSIKTIPEYEDFFNKNKSIGVNFGSRILIK